MGGRLLRAGVFALCLALARLRRTLLNVVRRRLPAPFCWFRFGQCTLCGCWGWVFWETGEHEQCWLSLK